MPRVLSRPVATPPRSPPCRRDPRPSDLSRRTLAQALPRSRRQGWGSRIPIPDMDRRVRFGSHQPIPGCPAFRNGSSSEASGRTDPDKGVPGA